MSEMQDKITVFLNLLSDEKPRDKQQVLKELNWPDENLSKIFIQKAMQEAEQRGGCLPWRGPHNNYCFRFTMNDPELVVDSEVSANRQTHGTKHSQQRMTRFIARTKDSLSNSSKEYYEARLAIEQAVAVLVATHEKSMAKIDAAYMKERRENLSHNRRNKMKKQREKATVMLHKVEQQLQDLGEI